MYQNERKGKHEMNNQRILDRQFASLHTLLTQLGEKLEGHIAWIHVPVLFQQIQQYFHFLYWPLLCPKLFVDPIHNLGGLCLLALVGHQHLQAQLQRGHVAYNKDMAAIQIHRRPRITDSPSTVAYQTSVAA